MSNRKLIPRAQRLTRWLFVENFGVLQLTDTWHQWIYINQLLPHYTRTKYEYFITNHQNIRTPVGSGHHITDHYFLEQIYQDEWSFIKRLVAQRRRDDRVDEYYKDNRLLPPLFWLPFIKHKYRCST